MSTKHLPEPATFDPLALLSKREVAQLCGVNPWTIGRWLKKAMLKGEVEPEASFPTPIWLSPITPRWSRAAIAAWMQSRPSGGRSPNTNLRRGATRVRLHKERAAR